MKIKANKIAAEEQQNLDFRVKSQDKIYNNIINSLLEEANREGLRKEIINNCIKLELNISPICDYAQQKMPCCRILPGLFIEKKYPIKKTNAFNYISDAEIRLDGIDYLLVFDFRYLYSVSNSVSKKRQSNFKLRQQLLADIQIKLGSHINRAGVLYL